jgi:hypothetical protein
MTDEDIKRLLNGPMKAEVKRAFMVGIADAIEQRPKHMTKVRAIEIAHDWLRTEFLKGVTS